MKIYKNIQQRLVTTPDINDITFIYNKKKYSILKESYRIDLIPESLPAGVIYTGFTKQFMVVESETGELKEAYIYFYKKLGEDSFTAILDAIEI